MSVSRTQPATLPSDVPAVDAITLTVVWNGLVSVCNDMGHALQRTAHSEIVRDAGDCGAAVFDAQGRNIAQGVFSPGMMGPMTFMVERILEDVPRDDLRPGDAVITNDIYIGAGHLPDAFTVSPVFVGDKLTAFVASSVHLMDVGGASPGSQTVVGVVDNYQEGLRIAPVRHFEAGLPTSSVLRLIATNVRFPEKVLGDIHSMVAANNFGAGRVKELVTRYGRDSWEACCERILRESEERTRAAIARVPDGTYAHEEYLDDYGPDTAPVRLAVDITVDGSDITVDWSRSDPQVPAGMNSARSYSHAYSTFTLKALISPDVPMNCGCIRPIEFIAPEGSFMNPRPPAPGGGRALTIHRHFETIMGALAEALPDRTIGACSQFCNIVAGGLDGTGNPYLLWDMIIGGFAARSSKDGTEGLCSVLNCGNVPVEVSELCAPVLVERLEFVPDSGGAGEFRGACAVRKDIRFLGTGNQITPITDRHRYPPHGVHGGGAGACGMIVVEPEGRAQAVHSKDVHAVEQGGVVRFQVSGAGGYGPPERRGIEAVLEDIREGYVSTEQARDQYGVVLDDAGCVDAAATARERSRC